MPAVNAGEVWMIDFGMAAKVRPALLLTGAPADDELDVVTTLLHTTALRGHQWELSIPKPIFETGRVSSSADSNCFDRQAGEKTGHAEWR
jgi:mRNA interferase MazF